MSQAELRKEWAEKFYNYLLVEKNGSRLTCENYRRDISDFEQFMLGKAGADFSWKEIQVIHIRSYLAWLNRENYARRTIARRISSLRSFFKFLLREEYVGQNPFTKVRTPKLDKRLPVFLEETEISIRKLTEFKGRITYILFRKDALEAWIQEEDNRQFLAEYGYEGCSLDSILSRIEGRYRAYIRENKAFPHEIGIFLGYPLADVQGFISNHGKNCLLCGCWKVYSNPESARRTFANYDRCRDILCDKLQQGCEFFRALELSKEEL